jgi:hypothetical protein
VQPGMPVAKSGKIVGYIAPEEIVIQANASSSRARPLPPPLSSRQLVNTQAKLDGGHSE